MTANTTALVSAPFPTVGEVLQARAFYSALLVAWRIADEKLCDLCRELDPGERYVTDAAMRRAFPAYAAACDRVEVEIIGRLADLERTWGRKLLEAERLQAPGFAD